MLEALCFERIKYPFWVRLIPFFRFTYLKRTVEEVLAERSDSEVTEAWNDAGIGYEKVSHILGIIAKYCGWRSARFIPSDECLCVFADYDLEMGSIAAIQDIEDCYPHIKSNEKAKTMPYMPKTTLYEYMRAVLSADEGKVSEC
jgi:hypothetical protein